MADDPTLDRIRRDKRYKRFQKRWKKQTSYDFDAALDEIESLHSQLKVRTLSRKSLQKGSQDKLIEASLQNQAHRSRIVQILFQSMRARAAMEHNFLAIREYLQTNMLRNSNTIGPKKNVNEP